MKHASVVLTVLFAVAWPLAASTQDAEVTHAATVKLGPFPNIPACSQGAAVHGDPATGPSTLFVRATAHCRIPRHWHTGNESLMFITGTGQVAMHGQPRPQTLRPGSFAYVPAKHQHAFTCPTACSFFVVSDAAFDIHYVDDAGNEIPMEKALPGTAAKPSAAAKKPEH